MFQVAWAATVRTCNCVAPPTLAVQIQQTNIIFAGKVVSLVPSGEDNVEVTFDVSAVWRGHITQTVTVETASGKYDCGYHFQANTEYLVYADDVAEDENEQKLVTGECSATKPLAQASADRELLKRSSAPLPDPVASRSWFRLLVLLTGVALIVIIVSNKRHK